MAQSKIVGIKRLRRGEEKLFSNDEDKYSFEKYLLELEVTWFQKFLAWLGQEVFIGDFRAEKPGCDFEHYFIFWCKTHRSHVVAYYKGYDRRLDCPECNKEYLSGIEKNISNLEDKKEKKLRLVKSDKGLKS